jgi:hypothetical protein
LVNVFCIYVGDDFSPVLSPEEIEEGRFWSETEIKESVGKGVLTPNFEQEYNRIREYINK